MSFASSMLIAESKSDAVSPYLKIALSAIFTFGREILKKEIVCTSLLRSIQEQVEICKQHEIKSDFQHVLGEAADLRERNLTPDEQTQLLNFVDKALLNLCFLKLHKKGTAPHLHLALIGEYRDMAKAYALAKNAGAVELFTG